MMGHQDQLEILDPRAPQVIVECQVSRDQADSRVHEDFEVPLGNQVNRENQVTMVHRVYRECPDLRDLQDQLVIKVTESSFNVKRIVELHVIFFN